MRCRHVPLAKNSESENLRVENIKPYKSTVHNHLNQHQVSHNLHHRSLNTYFKSLRQYNEVLTIAIAR